MHNWIAAYNCERLDPHCGLYHLGNGYRTYSPKLMRFTIPDSWSPFGAGGLNSYGYCANDPINHMDPSGHINWQAWLGIGASIAGIALAVITAGTSIAVSGGVIAAMESASYISLAVGTTALIADSTGIASVATEESSPGASAVLGWISFGAGVLSLGSALSTRLVNSVTTRGNQLVNTFRRELSPMQENITRATRNLAPPFTPPQTIYPLGLTQDTNSLKFMSFARGKTENSLPHLDVFGHGGIGQNGVGRFNLNEAHLNAEELQEYLSRHIENYAKYRTVRLITCHSANEGYGSEPSLAFQLAQISQKNVIGFQGIVHRRFVSGLTTGIIDASAVSRYTEFNNDLSEITNFLNDRHPPLNTDMEVTGTAIQFFPS